jgi:DNA-binding transcriptional ArsR family regulator
MPESVEEGPDEARPFIDSVFDALADWRRREVCQYFIETGAESATVDQLAMLLLACEQPGVEERPDPTLDELAIQLEHQHLPRLDEAGVVDFDDRSNTVRYWGQPTVEKWLEHVLAVDEKQH